MPVLSINKLTRIIMKGRLTTFVVLLSVLPCREVEGGTSSCQDIDHNACVSMAAQNPNMCANHIIATSACPQYCAKCPNVCYDCLATAQNMSQCNTITCAQGEKCMVRSKDNSNGERYYSMICGPKLVCSDFRKRSLAGTHSLHNRNVYSVCCDQDMCNVPSLLTATTTTTPPTTTIQTTTKATTSQGQHQSECVKDVVFMIEDTLQILPFLGVVKDQIKAMVNHLNIGTTKTRLGLGKFYDDTASTVWDLNSYRLRHQIFNAIDRLGPQHILSTHAYNIKAADFATDHFNHGNRPGVPDVLVIFSQTDKIYNEVHPFKMSSHDYDHIITMMRRRYPDIITIASGSANIAEMQRIATDVNHYFYINPPSLGLGGFNTDKLINDVTTLICQG